MNRQLGWSEGRAGVRPRNVLDDALAYELADCLWSFLTLADCYDVDLEAGFTETVPETADHIESLDGGQPLD